MRAPIFLLLCIGLICCQNEVNLADQEFPLHIQMNRFLEPDETISGLSQIAKRIEYVMLETNPECLIGYTDGVRPTKNGFLINHKAVIYHFGKDGRYLSRIDHKGKGPGEYLRILHQYYHDDENGIVGIPDCQKSFNFYDYTGKFINSVSLKGQQGNDWSARLIDGSIFVGPILLAKPMFKTINQEGELIFEAFPGSPERNWSSDINGNMYFPRLWISESPNGVLAHEYDTTWLIRDAKTIEPYFVIDPYKSENEDMVFPAPIQYLNENYVGFEAMNYRIFSLADGKYYTCACNEQGRLTDDIHQGLPLRVKTSFDGKIYELMNAIDLLQPEHPDFHPDKKLTQIIKGLQEDDNPVLRIVTLRDEFIIDESL